MESTHIQVTRDRLVSDLRNVVADSEALLKEVAGELTEKGKQARERLVAALESAKTTCAQLQDKAQAGMEATDLMVREHPYTSVGVAFAVGVLVGVLVARG